MIAAGSLSTPVSVLRSALHPLPRGRQLPRCPLRHPRHGGARTPRRVGDVGHGQPLTRKIPIEGPVGRGHGEQSVWAFALFGWIRPAAVGTQPGPAADGGGGDGENRGGRRGSRRVVDRLVRGPAPGRAVARTPGNGGRGRPRAPQGACRWRSRWPGPSAPLWTYRRPQRSACRTSRELGFGAIGEGGVRVVNPDVCTVRRHHRDEMAEVERRERAELERRARRFRASTSRWTSPAGR